MKIEIIQKDTVWYKKIRNGTWRVMKGNKKVSEHSSEKGARETIKLFAKQKTE